MNDEMRALLTVTSRNGSPESRPARQGGAVVPPGSKRGLRDNGVWAGAFTRDNVELVTTGIREITPSGVLGADGPHWLGALVAPNRPSVA